MRPELFSRVSELASLDATFEQAAQGRGALVTISGEPGTGKSLLVREFITSHPEATIITAAATGTEQSPFEVWIDLVALLERTGTAAEPPTMGEPPTTPTTAENMSTDVKTSANQALTLLTPENANENSADQLRKATTQILELMSLTTTPLVIIIENIQNLDPGSERLLNRLSLSITNEPILIISTRLTDPSGRPTIDIPPQSLNISLHGLSTTEVRRLLAAAYPTSDPNQLESLAQNLHQATGGNPSAIQGIIEKSIDSPPNEQQLLGHLLEIADLSDRAGNTNLAYTLYAQVSEFAEQVGDDTALAAAAVGFVFPPDWRAGHSEVLTLVTRVRNILDKSSSEDSPQKIIVAALRAMVEMRIPKQAADGNQWAWVVRSEVAQSMSAEALNRARTLGDNFALLVSLTAWRWTHRSPRFLASRREISAEMLDIALSGKHAQFIIEACVRSIVDALEAGDRKEVEKLVNIAEWISECIQDPRLKWRAALLKAALPGLDGDWERFHELREEALALGIQTNHPGTIAMDTILKVQYLVHTLDPIHWDWDNPTLQSIAKLHPLSSATWAFGLAQAGDTKSTLEWIRHSMSLLDEETSLTATLALLSYAALRVNDTATIRQIIPLLDPWSGRMAVDADGGVIVGPIDLILAKLYAAVGESDRAQTLAKSGTALKKTITSEISNLDRLVADPAALGANSPVLTNRERSVLELLGAGLTNQEIAGELSYSLATVRRDTINLYKKLGVKSRAGAVQRASELGLLK